MGWGADPIGRFRSLPIIVLLVYSQCGGADSRRTFTLQVETEN